MIRTELVCQVGKSFRAGDTLSVDDWDLHNHIDRHGFGTHIVVRLRMYHNDKPIHEQIVLQLKKKDGEWVVAEED